MRIISGKFKGRRFSPPGNFKARPTTDFAKENLFNILNNEIEWESIVALDLFGGTGSISFELISRGCSSVTCVEKHPVHTAFIEKVKGELKIQNMKIFKLDVFKFLEHSSEKYDLIFADPPYDLKNFADVPHLILERGLLKDGGIFIQEHSKDYDFSGLPYFREKRIYGSVNFSIFEKN